MNLSISEGHRTYLFQMAKFIFLHKVGNKLNTRMKKDFKFIFQLSIVIIFSFYKDTLHGRNKNKM